MTTENDEGSASPEGLLTDLVAQQNRILEQLARPYVVVDVVPRRYVNILYFRIRNVGKTPAFNVRVCPDTAIPIGGESSAKLNIFKRGISALGAGDEISFFFGSALELLDDEKAVPNDEKAVLQFKVRVEYADSNGRPYEDTIAIDVDLLRGLAIELPASHKMLEILSRTRTEVGKIARYTEKLRHRDLLRSTLETEEETRRPTSAHSAEDDPDNPDD